MKLLDLKNASPDSRLCKTVTVPVLWSSHDSLSPGCYSAVAFTSVCRVAELHSCNNSGYHILWLSGCCWWHGLPHVMHCSWSREKQISIPRLSIYPNCMIDGRHCNLCYLDMVAGGSQCSDYLVGHYYQIAIMTGCGCPPSWWPWWPWPLWPTSTAAGTWSCARHWGTNTS